MTTTQDRPSRPSLPYQKVPTGQQRNAQDEGTAERRLAQEVHPPTFTAEEWLALVRKMADEAVIRTRNDERLRRDVDVAQDQSKTIMSLMSSVKRLKVYLGLLIGISTGVGGAAAAAVNAYQSARLDAVEPAARAEAKAERADRKAEVVATAVEERMTSFEKRHAETESVLADLSETLKANTKAINQLDSKLDAVVQAREKRTR